MKEQTMTDYKLLLTAVLNSSTSAMCILDSKGIVIDINNAYCNLTGFKKKELVGKKFNITYNKKDSIPILKEFNEFILSNRIFEHKEKKLTLLNGKLYIFEVSYSKIEISDGKYVLCIMHDIIERKQAEEERLGHLKFFESMNKVNQVIQETNDIEQMMSNVLEIVLSIFNCDRTWLLNPCDPEEKTFRVPMEITKPEYPGTGVLNVDVPMTQDMAQNIKEVLESSEPVTYLIGTENPINKIRNKQFSIKSMMMVAIYPKTGKPWTFGLHQCSYARVWTQEEKRLFQEISRRLSDSLSSFLILHNLKESEERYRLIAENTADTIAVYDLNLNPTYISPSIQKLRGYTVQEAMIQSLNQVLTPESLQKVEKAFANQIALETKGNSDPSRAILLELEEYCKDGSTILIELAASFIRNDNLKATGILTVTRDITERKKAEEAIFEGQKVFRTLVENSPDIIARYDRNCKRTYVNPVYLKVAKIQQEKLISTSPIQVSPLPSDSALVLQNLLRKVFDSGIAEAVDLIWPKSDNIDYWYNVYAFPEFNREGQVVSVMTISRDITERKKAEQKIIQLASIVEYSDDAIFSKSLDGIILSWNKGAENIYGYTETDILGKSISLLMSQESKDEMSYILKKIKDGEHVEHYETIRQRKDGKNINVSLTISPLLDSNEKIIGASTIGRDITERKLAEKKIARINRTFRMLSDSNQALIHITDETTLLKEICNIAVNSGYLMAWVGFAENNTDKSVLPVAFAGFDSGFLESVKFSWGDNERGRGPCGTAIRTGKPCITRNIILDYNFAPWRDAAIRSGYKSIICLPLIIEDKILGVLGIYSGETDSFDKKEVEILKELAEDLSYGITALHIKAKKDQSEEELRKLSTAVEQSPVTIIITDINANIIYANPKATEITGYKIEELIGKNPRILKSGLISDEIYKELWKTIKSGKVWNGEFLNKKKNGELYWEYASISPIVNKNGEITHYLAIKEDITERKNMINELIIAKEKAEEMNRLKTNFLANMSHEIRTPLSGILGFTSILNCELKDPSHLEYTSAIEKSGKRLLETLNLILDFSKLEAEKVYVNYSNVRVEHVIDEVIKSFESMARNKNLYLKQIIKGKNFIVNIDERFLRQIMNNLVNNAIKFTDNGGITVELGKDANQVIIKVKDTGLGIACDKFDVIFEEFRQESEGYSRGFEGTGLGLSITKRFVELMKGTIEIESEVGIGSTFTVKFPNLETPEDINIRTDKQEEEKEIMITIPSKEDKLSVLLVEDDEINRDLTIAMLIEYYNVEYADEGYEAIEKAKDKIFDIILMDINLGKGINGIEVTRRIRKLPEYAKTPIVALTAFVLQGDREEFIAGGCTHYLGKPFTKNQLLELLKNINK